MAFFSRPALPPAPRFKPQCTHLTMTRLYGFNLLCDACGRSGPFGWVYCCTQDREDLIEHCVAHGFSASFDELGDFMSSKMEVRPRSPAARADRLSFLDEITPEQYLTYQPHQVQKVLRQREGVHFAIAQDTLHEALDSSPPKQSVNGRASAAPSTDSSKSWLPLKEHECRYQVCPFCRPGAADRSFLSLTGVANGVIQPTSAVGYGFHLMGERPVVDAEVLKSIRCRPVPLIRSHAIRGHARTSSDSSLMAMLGDQLALASENDRRKEAESNRAASAPPFPDAGRLKHSPRCENLAIFAEPKEVLHHGAAIRPPWTPPPSPSPHGEETATEMHSLGLAAEKSIASGRSSRSLKTNLDVRHQTLRSVPSQSALDRINQSENAEPQSAVPYLSESEYDVGLTLPFNQALYELACMTPLEQQPRGMTGQVATTANASPRVEEESKPVLVSNGVAMMEESLELGVPDVVTQV